MGYKNSINFQRRRSTRIMFKYSVRTLQ